VNAHQRLRTFGWCRTKIDADGDEIELGCVTTGSAPPCVSVTLENPAAGLRNLERRSCDPEYAPYSPHFYPDALNQFRLSARFRDAQQPATFAVDTNATLMLMSYRPEAHFERRLVIPDIRLAEWSDGLQ